MYIFTSISKVDYSKLNIENTYTFELISIYNKVVIPYKESKIIHIGTRNNTTLEEFQEDIGIEKPATFKFLSIEDIILNADKLPYDKEGYVAVDNRWNRVKIKSPAYVAIHHMKENGKVSPKRILTIVRKGEKEEFLNYFPEYGEEFIKIETLYNKYIQALKEDLEETKTFQYKDRKEFALFATKKTNPHLLFQYLDKKINTVEEFLAALETEKLAKTLNLFE